MSVLLILSQNYPVAFTIETAFQNFLISHKIPSFLNICRHFKFLKL